MMKRAVSVLLLDTAKAIIGLCKTMTTPNANPPLKLVYFCARGRAEPVRLMLELAGVPYEYEGVPTIGQDSTKVQPRQRSRTP